MADDASRSIVALFDDPAVAQAAAAKVEAAGVDAGAIHLLDDGAVPAPRAVRAADMQVERRVVGGAVRGGVVWAVVLAAVAVGALALLGAPIGFALLFGVIIGVIIGGLMGGYWGGLRTLPMNEAAYDAELVDPRDVRPVALEVKLLPVVDEARVLATLSELHPTHIERRG